MLNFNAISRSDNYSSNDSFIPFASLNNLHTEIFNHRYVITVEKNPITPFTPCTTFTLGKPKFGKNPTTTFLRRIFVQQVQYPNPSSLGKPNNKKNPS